jgi:hypothetical protein
VLAANYPFATIEPNTGVVGLPDPRLSVLETMHAAARVVPATVTFVDIAGIVKGASQGEGMGNAFLAHIREADAICQVTRVFRDPDVTHVDGKVDPGSDISTITTELILADLQTLEKALPRVEKEARIKKEARPRYEAMLAAQEVLDSGRGVFQAGLEPEPLRDLFLLTAKPYLYVFNMDADELSRCPQEPDGARLPRRSSSTPSSRPSWSISTRRRPPSSCTTRASTSGLTCSPASAGATLGSPISLPLPSEARA